MEGTSDYSSLTPTFPVSSLVTDQILQDPQPRVRQHTGAEVGKQNNKISKAEKGDKKHSGVGERAVILNKGTRVGLLRGFEKRM